MSSSFDSMLRNSMRTSLVERVVERLIFAVTNPTNVTKIVENVSTARAKKKHPEDFVDKTIKTVVYDPIMDARMEIIRNLDKPSDQLKGLSALEAGEAAFEEFIVHLERSNS
jgi:hypothetical protein